MRTNCELRTALDMASTSGLLTGTLRADAYDLCAEAEAGRVPLVEAREEIHALISGLAIRALGIGARCCAIADQLVRQLVGDRWRGITTPGATDRSNPRTGMVQLRFPATDFWSVTAVAHEAGHLLAREHDFAARRVIDEGEPKTQREELFCDFYATYVIGPAYPAYMITEELEPAHARPERTFPDPDAASASHPTPDKRVLMMLKTLAAMDETDELFAPYQQVRTRLADAWQRRLGSTAHDLEPNAAIVVTHLFNRLWKDVVPVLGKPYLGSIESRRLADDLRAPHPSPPVEGLSIRDVVAAAWRARFGPPADGEMTTRIERRAVAAAQCVINAGRSSV